jgi:hypothetical protein
MGNAARVKSGLLTVRAVHSRMRAAQRPGRLGKCWAAAPPATPNRSECHRSPGPSGSSPSGRPAAAPSAQSPVLAAGSPPPPLTATPPPDRVAAPATPRRRTASAAAPLPFQQLRPDPRQSPLQRHLQHRHTAQPLRHRPRLRRRGRIGQRHFEVIRLPRHKSPQRHTDDVVEDRKGRRGHQG